MTDQKKDFHKPLGIDKNEKKANKLRDQVKDNLNRFVKDEKLSKAELSIFDKLTSRKNFLVGTAKISALAALVGKGLMPSAFAAEHKDFQLSNDDYKDIDPQLLSKLEIPAKIVPSADVMDNQILVKDFEDIPNAGNRECVIESLNASVRIQETANLNDSPMSGLNDLNRSYGVPEIAQLSPNNDKIILNEYNPGGGTGYLKTEIELEGRFCDKLIGFNGDSHNLIGEFMGTVWNKKALAVYRIHEEVNFSDSAKLMELKYQDDWLYLDMPGKKASSAKDIEWKTYTPLENLYKHEELRSALKKFDIDQASALISIDYVDVYKSDINKQFIFGSLSVKKPGMHFAPLKVGFTLRYTHSKTGLKLPFSFNCFTINLDHYVKMYKAGLDGSKNLGTGVPNGVDRHYFNQVFYPLCETPGNPGSFIFNWIAYDFNQDSSSITRRNINYPIQLPTLNIVKVESYANYQLSNAKNLVLDITDERSHYGAAWDNTLKAYQNWQIELFNSNYIDANEIHDQAERADGSGWTFTTNPSHLISMASGLKRADALVIFGSWSIWSNELTWPRSYFSIQPNFSDNGVTLKLIKQNLDFSEHLPKGYYLSDKSQSYASTQPLITKNHQGLFQFYARATFNPKSDNPGKAINNAVVCYREEGEKRHESPFPQIGDPIDGSRKNGVIFASTFNNTEDKRGVGNNIIDNGVERILNWTNYLNSAETIVLHNILMEQSNSNEKYYNYCTQDYIENNWQSHKLQIQVTAEERILSQHIVKKPLHTVELHLLNAYDRPVVTDANTYVEIRLADQAYVRDSTDPTNLAYQKANRYQSFLAKPIAGKVVLDINLGDDNRDLGRGTTLMYRILHSGSLQVSSQNTRLTSPLLKFDLSKNDTNVFEFQSFNISYKVHERMADEYETGKSNNQIVDDHKKYQNIANDTSQEGGGGSVTQKYSIQESIEANYSSDNPYNPDGHAEVDTEIKAEMITGKDGKDPKILEGYKKVAEASKPKDQIFSSLLFQNEANIAVVNPLTHKLGYNHAQAMQLQLNFSFNPIDWIKDALRLLKKAIKAAIEFIKKTIKAVLDSIAQALDVIGLHGLADAVRFLETVVNSILDAICDFITAILDLIIALLDFQKIIAIANALGGFIDAGVDKGYGEIQKLLQQSNSGMSGFLSEHIDNANKGAKTFTSPQVTNALNDNNAINSGNKINQAQMKDSASNNQFLRHMVSTPSDTQSSLMASSDLALNFPNLQKFRNISGNGQNVTPEMENTKNIAMKNMNSLLSMSSASHTDVASNSGNIANKNLMTSIISPESANGSFINDIFGSLLDELKSGFDTVRKKSFTDSIPVLSEIFKLLGISLSFQKIACFVAAVGAHVFTEVFRTMRIVPNDFDLETGIKTITNKINGNSNQVSLNKDYSDLDIIKITMQVVQLVHNLFKTFITTVKMFITKGLGLPVNKMTDVLDFSNKIVGLTLSAGYYSTIWIEKQSFTGLDGMVVGVKTVTLFTGGIKLLVPVEGGFYDMIGLFLDIVNLVVLLAKTLVEFTWLTFVFLINAVASLIKDCLGAFGDGLDPLTKLIIAGVFAIYDVLFFILWKVLDATLTISNDDDLIPNLS